MDGLFLAVRAKKASWPSKLITLTSEKWGSACNSSTLNLSFSLFHRYDESQFVCLLLTETYLSDTCRFSRDKSFFEKVQFSILFS